jgi:hypothetical protein
MSLVVEVEIESKDTAVKRCTQALIDCSATGCFIDIEWVKLNNIPTCPLTKPIPVYNVNGTANVAGMIMDIADVILRYENHSEHTQLAVTHLGKQSLILGYNWLRNHNLEINWQTRDVKMSHCPLQYSTCRVEDKREAKIRKSTTSQINACRAGAFPTMVEEDEDESPHVNTDETDEEAQDMRPTFDDDLDSEVNDLTIEEGDRIFMAMVHLVDPHHFVHALSMVSGRLAEAFAKNFCLFPYLSSPLLLSPCSYVFLPHLCTISRDHTQSRQLLYSKSDDFPDVDSPKVVNFPSPLPLVP